MNSLIGIVFLLLLTIVVGKRIQRVSVRTYFIVLLIAILQVCVVLVHMYTMEPPVPAV